jgi:hypothetical protein
MAKERRENDSIVLPAMVGSQSTPRRGASQGKCRRLAKEENRRKKAEESTLPPFQRSIEVVRAGIEPAT